VKNKFSINFIPAERNYTARGGWAYSKLFSPFVFSRERKDEREKKRRKIKREKWRTQKRKERDERAKGSRSESK
jgi:hypothetical protein